MAITQLPVSPFITDPENRFDAYFDEDRFMAEIAEMPAFLVNPSPEYLSAVDIEPIAEIIRGHAA